MLSSPEAKKALVLSLSLSLSTALVSPASHLPLFLRTTEERHQREREREWKKEVSFQEFAGSLTEKRTIGQFHRQHSRWPLPPSVSESLLRVRRSKTQRLCFLVDTAVSRRKEKKRKEGNLKCSKEEHGKRRCIPFLVLLYVQ